jgi:hypothetical protein
MKLSVKTPNNRLQKTINCSTRRTVFWNVCISAKMQRKFHNNTVKGTIVLGLIKTKQAQ